MFNVISNTSAAEQDMQLHLSFHQNQWFWNIPDSADVGAALVDSVGEGGGGGAGDVVGGVGRVDDVGEVLWDAAGRGVHRN